MQGQILHKSLHPFSNIGFLQRFSSMYSIAGFSSGPIFSPFSSSAREQLVRNRLIWVFQNTNGGNKCLQTNPPSSNYIFWPCTGARILDQGVNTVFRKGFFISWCVRGKYNLDREAKLFEIILILKWFNFHKVFLLIG